MAAISLAVESSKKNFLPLCCSYLIVFSVAVPVQVKERGVPREHVARWALGMLADGDFEILGVWLELLTSEMHWQLLFENLRSRGVERIRFIACEEVSAVTAALRASPSTTKVLPLLGDLLAESLAPYYAATASARRIVRWRDEVVHGLQGSVIRSVSRRGCFDDSAVAVAAVREALARAERALGIRHACFDQDLAKQSAPVPRRRSGTASASLSLRL